MMLPIDQIINVNNLISGGPEFQAAAAICDLRGVDPYGQNMGSGVQNWRAVIVEEAIFNSISQMVRPQ